MSFGTTTKNNQPVNPNNDAILSDPPNDSIQAIKWAPTDNLLASASWDCTVRAYKFDCETGSSNKIGEYKNDAPPLDVLWSPDSNNIISAGCDKIIKLYDLQTSKTSIIGHHSKPIRKIALCENTTSTIISGGWDKQIKCWDPKQSCSSSNNQNIQQLKPVGNINVSERVYAMDLVFPILCIALANKKVLIYDIRKPNKPIKEMITLLKHQLRCIALFPNKNGFAVGSVEGRCGIHYINDENKNNKQKDFAFKCHRKKQDVYAVNSIKFHKQFETFSSAGGDGTIYFWDKNKKQKLKEFKSMDLPVTDVDFNYNGQIFAYSISYDWSKGIEHFQPKQQKPQIFIHKLQQNEIMPKKG